MKSKNLLAALLCLMLALGSAALADAADFRGFWFLKATHADGKTTAVSDMGVVCSLNFNWDGSGELRMQGKLTELSLTERYGESYACISGSSSLIPLRLEEDCLFMEMNDAAFIFTRNAPGNYSRIPPVAENAVLEDYIGVWAFESLTNEYGVYTAEALLNDMTLQISGESFTLTIHGSASSGACHMDGAALVLEELDSSAQLCTDGNLYVESVSEVMKYVPLAAENDSTGR